MNQEAILFDSSNVDVIVADLDDYPNSSELLGDYYWMLKMHSVLVLARDVQDDGWASVSYVVTTNMFERNQPGIKLNSETFTHVRTF